MSTRRVYLSTTFSIIACDPATGEMGIAMLAARLGTGERLNWIEPQCGVVALHSPTSQRCGTLSKAMLANGMSAAGTVAALAASDASLQEQQMAILDRQGCSAAFTGNRCLSHSGHRTGTGYAILGMAMTHPTVVNAMEHAYKITTGHLSARLLAALKVAWDKSAHLRSAGMKIMAATRQGEETRYDLRVDDHPEAFAELARLVHLRQGQLLNEEGEKLLLAGNSAEALKRWKAAREAAPEQTELAFWQAALLVDRSTDKNLTSIAGRILGQVTPDGETRDCWLTYSEQLAAMGYLDTALPKRLAQALEEE